MAENFDFIVHMVRIHWKQKHAKNNMSSKRRMCNRLQQQQWYSCTNSSFLKTTWVAILDALLTVCGLVRAFSQGLSFLIFKK
jgi:hypothetical protein